MKKYWWKEAVVYQIYPRSFMDADGDGIGDLQGIIQKLDHLRELGVDVIWLSPVYDSPNDDNGYDIRDYQAIMAEFGNMQDFDSLLEEAHRRNLKIMMDLVVNHTSDEHAWFIESRQSKDAPKRDFYIWKDSKDGGPPNNWEAAFKGSAWEYDKASGQYYLHLFSRKQPDLNWENSSLREKVYETMKWWLDKGIDGFRMDVINFISKDQRFPDGPIHEGNAYGDGSEFFMNGPRIHEFLQEMNDKVLSKYNIITVGEMPGVSVEEAKRYTGENRNELHMVFHFDHVGLGDGPDGKWNDGPWKLTDLKKIFSKWQEGLEEDGWNSLYWSNHDQPRAVSRFGNDSPQYREKSAKMLAVCLHMLKGTPYIYQGEEIGMTNAAFDSIEDYRDIETLNSYREFVESDQMSVEEMMSGIKARSRDNARTPMQWSGAAHAGFTVGEPWISVNPNYKYINVEEQRNQPGSVFQFYKKLIELRKTYDVIVYGRYEMLAEDDEHIYAYKRTLGDETLLVVCNFSDQSRVFQWPERLSVENGELLITNQEAGSSRVDGHVEPYEAFVYYFPK
ncbi:MAG TPA: alpha-glucosidase [Bacillales bacterium]|nr:alpha-glucosidase [Bacillales bacterium]